MAKYRYKRGEQPLDGYTIEHGLGVGGFGEVYYAVSDSGREVALKCLTNYQDIELRGIGHCMNLKSPHLVTIFDVKENDDEESFVIMEYVQGPSLRLLLDGSPEGLGPTKAAFFLREMAKGLSYLHEAGVVHRDLKPHNVFYEEGFVKIGDYSLCKSMSTSHRTGHTMTVGTVHYMAPEISEGRYDASVDIYALGVMLYEMLTGTPPFVGNSIGEVLMKHMTAEPDLSMIEEPFRQTIAKALAKNPNDRFASPADMVESLFGAEHVQNSVVEFNPQELTMVANMATRKANITPSGRPASSRPGGASWGKTWKPETDAHQGSDWKSGPTAVYEAERANATPPPIGHVPHSAGPQDTNDFSASDAASKDRMSLSMRVFLGAVVTLAIAAFSGSPGRFIAAATTIALGTIASLAIRQFAPHTFSRRSNPKYGRLIYVAPIFATTFLILSLSGRSAMSLAAMVALPFIAFDWPALTAATRRKRLHTWPVIGVFGMAYWLSSRFLTLDSAMLTSSIAVGIAICIQLVSTFRPVGAAAQQSIDKGQPRPLPPAPQLSASKPAPTSHASVLGRPTAAQAFARIVGGMLFVVSAILGILAATSALPNIDLIDIDVVRILAAVGFGLLVASFGLQLFGTVAGEKISQIIVSTILLGVVHWHCMTERNMGAELVVVIPIAVGFFAWGKRTNGARI